MISFDHLKNKTMTKKYIIALFLFVTTISFSQKAFEISPSAGYMVSGRVQFVEGIFDIKDAPSFGVSASIKSNSHMGVELDYTWASATDAHFRSSIPLLIKDFDTKINIHHISINSISYLTSHETIQPFFNIGLGLAIFDIKDSGKSDPVKFSLNMGLGLKYFINDRIGIKLQARIIAPLLLEGVGFYGSVGSGGSSSGLSLNTSIPILEGDFRGGLIIRLGE